MLDDGREMVECVVMSPSTMRPFPVTQKNKRLKKRNNEKLRGFHSQG